MSINRLQEQIRKLKSPILLTLDPDFSTLPSQLMQQAIATYGQTLNAVSVSFYNFCTQLLDRLCGVVPAVMLKSTCFEAIGAEGVAQMQRISQYAATLGYYVLIDSMHSEEGIAAATYAQSMFGSLSIGEKTYKLYDCDGLTLNPLLGSDGIKPFLPYCKKEGKSIFLLIKSSNPSSREVQELLCGDRVVYTAMADLAVRWGNQLLGKHGYSEIGAIVAANNPQALKLLRENYDRLFFLVTGYEAQGSTAKNVQYAFDRFGHGAIVAASSRMLCAWNDDGVSYLEQAEKVLVQMKTEIGRYVKIL